MHKHSHTQPLHSYTALTCSTYIHAQALGHAAHTLVHSTHTQHVHSCTSAQTRSTYTHAQALEHAARTRVHSTHSTYTCAQALRHAACTLVHSTHTQHVHWCTSAWTRSMYTCTSTWTRSPYTRAQQSHTARTLMHKRSDTQPVPACTALRHAARTHMHSTQTQRVHACTHTPFITCAHSHKQRYTCACAHTAVSHRRRGA